MPSSGDSTSSPEKVRIIADELMRMGFEKIYPIHCSGDYTREYLRTEYPGFMEMEAWA